MTFTAPGDPSEPVTELGAQPVAQPAPPVPEYLAHLRSALENASRDLDRVVLTVSAGSLALSLTFLRDLGTDPRHPTLLQTAWALLFLSLALMLVSIFVSGYNIRRRLRRIRLGLPEGERLRWLTRRLTDLSCVVMVSGVGLLVSFAILNT